MKYNIRILLLLIWLITSVITAHSTQIKIIVFGDTNDSSIGESVATDIKSYKKLANDIKEAVKDDGVTTTLEVFSGANCSNRKLNAYLDNLYCENDVVFFIYNGHGGRSHSDTSKFPRMCLASHYESEWMKVSDLNNRLRQKKPRLMVVATDCCNSYYDRKRGNDESAYGISSTQSNGKGLRELFLNHTGEVCITASQPGEYGWGTSDGGLFSLCFINHIYKADALGSNAGWDKFIQDATNDTYSTSLNYYNQRRISNTQKPVYDVKVNKSEFNGSTDSDNNTDNDTDINDNTDNIITDDSDNDFTDDELYEDDDDELYEDDGDTDRNFGRNARNALWILLLGLLFLWLPNKLKLTGIASVIMKIISIMFFIWAFVMFIS